MPKKRKPKFRVGQVVCLVAFPPPRGLCIIRRHEDGSYVVAVECDNAVDERDFPQSELRPLNDREVGRGLDAETVQRHGRRRVAPPGAKRLREWCEAHSYDGDDGYQSIPDLREAMVQGLENRATHITRLRSDIKERDDWALGYRAACYTITQDIRALISDLKEE